MEEEVAYNLPSPTDTPYRTPSSSRSRRSHPYDMSPSSSPPPLPSDERVTKRRSNESINHATDESISPFDPRRFTPTLHASLVSEILSLRRDLEGKAKDIDQLELSLHDARAENNSLSDILAANGRETRSLKRQMQLLEGGTVSAVSEIAKERDAAQSDLADLRKRLEQSQRRAKSQEENAERTQAMWDQERETWHAEKRNLQTKIHIVEGRIKVILDEVAQSQAVTNGVHEGRDIRDFAHGRAESPYKRPPSTLSLRRQSATSTNSEVLAGRASVLGTVNGLSIADELAFDEEDEDQEHIDEEGRHSLDALPEEFDRPMSSLSAKARKILGIPLDSSEHDIPDSPGRRKHSSILLKTGFKPLSLKGIGMHYVDSAVQYSPPPSPKIPSMSGTDPHGRKSEPIQAAIMQWNARVTGAGSVKPVPNLESRDVPWNVRSTNVAPAMVSVSCQTSEPYLKHIPATTETNANVQEVISENVTEPVQMRENSTQTETEDTSSGLFSWVKRLGDIHELQIPTIAIIPPGSRPATPETNVVLPPRTKNASCQVNIRSEIEYSHTGTQTQAQTQASKIEARVLDSPFAPYMTLASTNSKANTASRSIPPNSSRRRFQPTPPPSMPAIFDPRKATLKENDIGGVFHPPDNDNGPLAKDFASDVNRPVRSSSLFAGFDDELELFDDAFEDDDIFRRPTAKFVLKSGKLISQEPVLEDIGENTAAANAGEAAALSHLRQSEDSIRSESRYYPSGRRSPPKRSVAPTKALRRVPSSKIDNFRRAALISSGTATHQSTNSQANSLTESLQSSQSNPPPFPVPNRFSSRRPAKSLPEGGRNSPTNSAASPTKRHKYRTKPTLRKARSGPAISPGPNGRRPRSRSPSFDPRVSIVPEMPSFQMPEPTQHSEIYQVSNDASAPRPSVATGPASRKASHVKTNSDAVSMQQTSVVDSIAQTMVGEWMFKYVRRRKSFGMPDAKPTDFDPSKNVEEISQNLTTTGVRHKRWVWLAPYERAVMWSGKQPTNGTALLGKSGRKLTIQSVLDVKDDNPMPKGSIVGPHFNRSILILTPQRALKFTAMSQDRHYVWLTALSFLSHSPLSLGDLQALPPPPSTEQGYLPPPSLAGSLRRRQIRDSIRIAKGPNRFGGLRSFTTDGSLPVQDILDQQEHDEYYDPSNDPALPPVIPRFSTHTRKRSNTAPRAPPSSFRGFSTRDATPSLPGPSSSTYSRSNATTVAGSSDRGIYTPSIGVASASSRRGSEASVTSYRPGHGPAQLNQLFDRGQNSSHGRGNANGTMRMDAFFDATPSVGQHRYARKDGNYWGVPEHPMDVDIARATERIGYGPSPSRSDDPFRGF